MFPGIFSRVNWGSALGTSYALIAREALLELSHGLYCPNGDDRCLDVEGTPSP